MSDPSEVARGGSAPIACEKASSGPVDADSSSRQRRLLSLVGMFKNEGRNIRYVLESVKPFIDRYTLIDTGSDDDTVAVMREVLAGIPGQIVCEPFNGYMNTRNRVLELDAQAENPAQFQLMMSGDERLVNGAVLREYLEARGPEADCNLLKVFVEGNIMSPRPVITRTGSDFKYFDYDLGVHEVAVNRVNPAAPVGICHGAHVEHDTSDPDRKLDTIRYTHLPLLVAAIERNSENARAIEYLAQSYEFLMNYEPGEDDQRHFAKEAWKIFKLRLALPTICEGERQMLTLRLIDAARASREFTFDYLLELANKLCADDTKRAEPAMLRTLIATKIEGITVGQIYKYAKEAADRAQANRMQRGIDDTAVRSCSVEWNAHRLCAIAAMNLAAIDPAASEIAKQHIEAGLEVGGPWMAFALIAREVSAGASGTPA